AAACCHTRTLSDDPARRAAAPSRTPAPDSHLRGHVRGAKLIEPERDGADLEVELQLPLLQHDDAGGHLEPAPATCDVLDDSVLPEAIRDVTAGRSTLEPQPSDGRVAHHRRAGKVGEGIAPPAAEIEVGDDGESPRGR